MENSRSLQGLGNGMAPLELGQRRTMVFKLGGKQFSSWNSVTKQTINQERGMKGLVPIRVAEGLAMRSSVVRPQHEQSHNPECGGRGRAWRPPRCPGHVPEGLLHQGCWSVQRRPELWSTPSIPSTAGRTAKKQTYPVR